jgi:hypothetical protein
LLNGLTGSNVAVSGTLYLGSLNTCDSWYVTLEVTLVDFEPEHTRFYNDQVVVVEHNLVLAQWNIIKRTEYVMEYYNDIK